jgi:hypothetical protein
VKFRNRFDACGNSLLQEMRYVILEEPVEKRGDRSRELGSP